ncbi:MAG: 4'-phosphopantetheinyl transferase superfamily protein [Gemmatimonadetes bacterium]|nr:4'-phosphopantetheinyl transferase superfamily protein [Gemmatimonadota bacterium]
MNGDGIGYTSTWQAAPAEPFGKRQPAESEIHVWRAALDLPSDRVGELERFLAADELERAKRFLVRSARDRYTVARAVLRNLLALYVSAVPAELQFHYTEYGKPELAHPATSIRFNVSHSHDLAVYAVTAGVPVGIDVEYLRRRATMDRLKIAHRVFSDREYNELASMPRYRRDEAFLACWTRKEAFVKAIGQGLSCPLDQFDVSVDPNDPPELRATHWDPLETDRWSMASVDPGPDYIGALAVLTLNPKITRWQWDHDQASGI